MNFKNRHNQKTICLIKGDPKYKIDLSDIFYKDIAKLIHNQGYKFISSESEAFIKAPNADAYILFSRGGTRGKWITEPKIYIGAPDHYKEHGNIKDLNIVSIGDKTFNGDESKASLESHWSLSKKDQEKIEQWLKNLMKD